MIIVRIRSQLGIWRLPDIDPSQSVAWLMKRISSDYNIPIQQQTLSSDPGGKNLLPPELSLQDAGVYRNGDMVFLQISEDADALVRGVNLPTSKKIAADGSIVNMTYEEATKDLGFRPGMPPLGDIKRAWTLTDFLDVDEKFVFKIKKQKESPCTSVTLDSAVCQSFQGHLASFGWNQSRVGYLYGTFQDDSSVIVHAMYEPPQKCSAEGFEVMDDPREAQVESLATMLGLRRVGWIFAHPPREEGYLFSSDEIIFGAVQQLEAGEGPNETPFVTVRCTIEEDGNVNFDAFSLSMQCMEMVAEGALEVDTDDRSSCPVIDTFTAVVEGKEAKSIDNVMFLMNVPVKQHDSPLLSTRFPAANRIGVAQTVEDLKDIFTNSGGRSFRQCLSDFGLLLFLMDFEDMFNWMEDMPRICEAVTNASVPVDEGYEMMIRSIAGMEV